MWCIPPDQDAAFVAQMEQVLQVYARPYDPKRPVVCMDEQSKQLIDESRQCIMTAGGEQRIDHEYIRQGVCNVWMFVEPLAGWRDVHVSDRRTAVDWAHRVKALVDDPRYAEAQRITLVCDNLNTHDIASLYTAFDADTAHRLARRLRIIHTPRNGSWLNMAEMELSVLTRQCIGRRFQSAGQMDNAIGAWQTERNKRCSGTDWRFTTADARIKLKRLYPSIQR